jgi:uncharacterized membrane-anchored protein YjiN (DUF445 family)
MLEKTMSTSLSPGDDSEARRALRRHKSFATFLLLVMAAVTVGAYWLPPGIPAEILQAAAKAGFVGGIADWFAVTALFRHPLGLPIPHTAIIPNQKVRLGQALGRFVANHVITPEEVARTLTRLDLPGIIARFLADPEANRPAARALSGVLPKLLAAMEDGRARRLISRLLPRMLGNARASVVVARALRGLVEGGRHQEVFGFILVKLRAGLAAKEEQLRQVVEDRVREQGGRLVGWALGASISRRVLSAVSDELDKMGPDSSELRLAVDEWVRREIARMEEDPARAEEIGRAIRTVLSHPTVQAWLWDVWTRLRMALEADAADPHGRFITVIEGALTDFGRALQTDEAMRARVQRAAEGIITTIMPSARLQLAQFIGDVIANWDSATIIDRLELRVGRDLQYVRVNGTLVGFLVGGLVYAVLRATFGHVAF